jgi:hypothetical protein
MRVWRGFKSFITVCGEVTFLVVLFIIAFYLLLSVVVALKVLAKGLFKLAVLSASPLRVYSWANDFAMKSAWNGVKYVAMVVVGVPAVIVLVGSIVAAT